MTAATTAFRNGRSASGSTWAIVPVKSLAEVKQRLAHVLPLEARRRLMLTMLEDVLAMLGQVEQLRPVLVVTPDTHVAELAETYGARVLREAAGRGHSAAAIAGFAEARARGAASALTLPADVPLITPGELRAVLGIAMSPHVTLVPSRDGDGTNLLLASPPDGFTPRFGPGSFSRHLAQAEADGIACRVVRLPGLAADIDAPGDLEHLIRAKRGDLRYAFLAPFAGRLQEAMTEAVQP